jgi:luciferase family oxidoreductase group 1
MQLGVMDNQRPDWMKVLVPLLDSLGYTRYWTTEQHSPIQSGSPTVAAAIAGMLSSRMRVGTAGVLLAFYSPVKVVEDFKLLELMFRGRVDLGIAGSELVEPMRGALLDGRPAPRPESYLERVRALVRIVRRHESATDALTWNQLGPRCRGTPDIWVCGTTERSARLAAELGVSYSFHEYLAAAARGGSDHGPAIMRTYREAFDWAASPTGPRCNVACYGICAETSPRAAELWRQNFPANELPSGPTAPNFCGTLEECRAQLEALQARYGVSEIIVQSITTDFEAYLTSYELLARACQLS